MNLSNEKKQHFKYEINLIIEDLQIILRNINYFDNDDLDYLKKIQNNIANLTDFLSNTIIIKMTETTNEKEQYIKAKYENLAKQIIALIDTPEKLREEVRLHCFGLRNIYHFLDADIDYILDVLETNNGKEPENLKKHRCPFGSCEDIRPYSPTFPSN